jgi:hypothetical protein
VRFTVEYFYDHQTDKLSILLSDFAQYERSEEVAPGVVLHVDARRRPLAIEISDARLIVGVKGLRSFEQSNMTGEELTERMHDSANGRAVLGALQSVIRRPAPPGE